MKNLMLIPLITWCISAMPQEHAQLNYSSSHQAKIGVPFSTMQTFQKDFPHAESPQWQHLGSIWVATFHDKDHGNNQIDNFYDSMGHLLERRTVLKKGETPRSLNEQIQSKYHTSDYLVIRFELSGQPIIYQVSVNLKSGRIMIYTDEQGNEITYKDPYL